MSDCDKAITKAIAEAYENSIKPPKHYWCAVHVIKAARRRASEYVIQTALMTKSPTENLLIHIFRHHPTRSENYTTRLWKLYTQKHHMKHISPSLRNGHAKIPNTSHTSKPNGVRQLINGQSAFATYLFKEFTPTTSLSRGIGTSSTTSSTGSCDSDPTNSYTRWFLTSFQILVRPSWQLNSDSKAKLTPSFKAYPKALPTHIATRISSTWGLTCGPSALTT